MSSYSKCTRSSATAKSSNSSTITKSVDLSFSAASPSISENNEKCECCYCSCRNNTIKKKKNNNNSSLVELWKNEYDSTSKEFHDLHIKYFQLKSRYGKKSDEIITKDLQILRLEKQIETGKRKSIADDQQINYWYKKVNFLKADAKIEKRRSVNVLKEQKNADDHMCEKLLDSQQEMHTTMNRLTIENKELREKNERIHKIMKNLTFDELPKRENNDNLCSSSSCSMDNNFHHYLCPTRASLEVC